MSKPSLSRAAMIIGASLAVTIVGGSAVALATASSSPNVYEGCLDHVLGALYNVHLNPSSTPRCLPRDTAVSWNQTGPQGPSGIPGLTREVIDLSATLAGGQPLPLGDIDIYYGSCNSGESVVSGGAYATEDENTAGVSTVLEQSGAVGDNLYKVVFRNNGTVAVHDFESLICAPVSSASASATGAFQARPGAETAQQNQSRRVSAQ